MGGSELPHCGAIAQADGSVHWRLWAPKASRVELLLIDGGRRRAVSMQPVGGGYFEHAEQGIAEGQRYAYRLDNGPERPDPASLWQPDGVHVPSAVLRPERFEWSDDSWTGVRRQDLVLYELHVGTFTPEGTFEAIVPRLDALRELGVTALELMPIAQFPGRRNWGYDGVHLHAPQNSYGGPHGLQRLVDACHRRGLAVFLDVVYNHVGPEGNYLHEFGPYFSERYRAGWGPTFNYDGPGSDPVRDFILDNVRLWLGIYHLDGLRLDATHSIHDSRPIHILREVKEVADRTAGPSRTVHVIAEDLRNDVRLLDAPERRGCGLDAEWSDDFHHAIHALLTGERGGYYQDFGRADDLVKVLNQTFALDGTYSHHRGRRWGAPVSGLSGDRFVVSIQNHDQVGNRARGDRLSTLLDPPALRLAASLLLLSPHLPLLFMGEEYGEENPFPFFCSFGDGRLIENVRQGRRRDYAAFMQGHIPDPQAETTFTSACLSWSWPAGSWHEGLRRLYRELLEARRRWPALRDFTHRQARLLSEGQAAVLHLVRGDRETAPADAWHVYFNLTPDFQPLPDSGGPGSVWLFSSEAARYNGARPAGQEPGQLWPHECVAFGPPLGEPLR
jgi:maltooligosyltrehalose trehalohydrolase